MNLNFKGTQSDENLQTVSATARLLISARRQKVHYRKQAMLSRAAEELGIDA